MNTQNYKKFGDSMKVKVDLHLHSFVSRSNGDGIKWTSLFDAISKLVENNVQIAAFSDHNKLDVNFYIEAKNLAQTANILLLPAIEVNVVRLDGQIANIIYQSRGVKTNYNNIVVASGTEYLMMIISALEWIQFYLQILLFPIVQKM